MDWTKLSLLSLYQRHKQHFHVLYGCRHNRDDTEGTQHVGTGQTINRSRRNASCILLVIGARYGQDSSNIPLSKRNPSFKDKSQIIAGRRNERERGKSHSILVAVRKGRREKK